MSSIPDPDNSASDAKPCDEHAAYDEWAAIAGEPQRFEDAAPTDQACGAASFDAIAATLTKTQVAAAAHPGSILVLAGAGTGKTSTLTAAVAHRIAVDGVPPRPRRHLHQQGGRRNGRSHPRRPRSGRGSALAGDLSRTCRPSTARLA